MMISVTTATSRCAASTSRLPSVSVRPLVRRRSRLPLADRRCFVSSSTSRVESQSSKICSVPFRLRPQDAMERMHIVGLMASGQISNIIYAGLLRLFGPSVNSFAREFGMGETLTMKGMKAVLYPIWRIDGIFEGPVESEKNRKEKDAYLAIEEGYVPGNPFAPLSYLSFSVPPLPDELKPYNPDRDLQQLGEGFEVVPVPFTVTPLGLLERLRSEIGKRTTWHGVRFDESKWSEQLLAMYPVMFPIYIAEFEHKTEARTWRYQVVVDAHEEQIGKCRISWPPPPELVKAGRFTSNHYINPAPFLPTTHFFLPSSMTPKDESPITSQTVAEQFQAWISPAPSSRGGLVPSPASNTEPENGIDWEDVRVQSWTAEERHDNGAFIEKSVELNKAIKAMQDFAEFSNRLGPDQTDATGTIITLGGKGGKPRVQQKSVSEMRADMERDVKRLRLVLEDVKPEWLKEWEKAKNFVKQADK